MKIYVRDQQSAECVFEDIVPAQIWNLQQFQSQYAPGICYFDLINFHLMLCIDLEACKVVEVCTDMDIEDVAYFVHRYEKAKNRKALSLV